MIMLGVWAADSALHGERQRKSLPRIRSFPVRVVVTMLSDPSRYTYFPLEDFGIYVLEACASQPRQREWLKSGPPHRAPRCGVVFEFAAVIGYVECLLLAESRHSGSWWRRVV